ncbi:MAG: FAD-binding protein [Desulfovibrionaceae bacterium]
MPTRTLATPDVLVLGAGLAGLRAAWAAAEAEPGLNISLATLLPGPSGSSFANRNNELGMQVPLTDKERADYVRETLALAAPGTAAPELVRLVAREAEARFHDMRALGLRFQTNSDGGLLRRPGCFSKAPRAAVFRDLSHAHALYRAHCERLNVRFLYGWEILKVERDTQGIYGVRMRNASVEERGIETRSLIMALGGPAPLHGRHIAGPGNSGRSWGMLKQAGARMENADYLQYMWFSLEDKNFRSPADLAGPDAVVRTPDGREVAPSAKIMALADSRRSHCPAAYGPINGVPDYAMDQWLQEQANADGVVRVKVGDGNWEDVALFAHAGNGGALVNVDGAVLDAGSGEPLPGLFACGECATGMHGANRLGGGMVTATQVFGKRAGEAAAAYAAGA